MSEVKEHSVIYLSPSDDPEREWCQDDVWEESVRYNLGADFDRVTAERDALQAQLTAADERADALESRVAAISSVALAVKFALEGNGTIGWEDRCAKMIGDLYREAAIKPAEAAKCCGTFPKCVCHEGADGL